MGNKASLIEGRQPCFRCSRTNYGAGARQCADCSSTFCGTCKSAGYLMRRRTISDSSGKRPAIWVCCDREMCEASIYNRLTEDELQWSRDMPELRFDWQWRDHDRVWHKYCHLRRSSVSTSLTWHAIARALPALLHAGTICPRT
jgi:hypothetical protein